MSRQVPNSRLLCPTCGSDRSRVLDSRGQLDSMSIRRRRECLDCRSRYTSYELSEPDMARLMSMARPNARLLELAREISEVVARSAEDAG